MFGPVFPLALDAPELQEISESLQVLGSSKVQEAIRVLTSSEVKKAINTLSTPEAQEIFKKDLTSKE